MERVNINELGIITKKDKSIEIGKIPGFNTTDFKKKPYMLKESKIKLFSGKYVKLSYGGITSNGEYTETCHLECKWGKNCISYQKGNCRYNPKITEIGFYMF